MSNDSISDADRMNPETWPDAHGDMLYRYALMKIRNPTIAEDLVQETFLAAIKGIKGFAGRSSIQTWLVGILKHKIVDYIRKDSREAYLENTAGYEAGTDLAFDRKGHWRTNLADWQVDPVRATERNELRDRINHAIQQLNPRLRDIFIARDLEGLDADEICERMGISTSNFWVSHHRARRKLRELLSDPQPV